MRNLLVSFCFGLAAMATPAAAVQSDCLAIASGEPRVVPAAIELAKLGSEEVRLTFLGHSSFIIESPGGTRIVTDYAGYSGGILPDAVTMNRAHSSHFTDMPDPAIKHVLRGWNPEGGPAVHDVEIGDIRVRNVTTDIRGGMAGRVKDGNSIFVFEVAGLCIGHLGHLHHLLGPDYVGLIGRLDVVMVPVDGGYTMGQAEMLEVLKTLKARVVIPMHYFGPATLNRFIGTVSGTYALETSTSPERILSVATLPDSPKLLVLPGY
ncbi:Zn-dependent hydrolase [Aestuariivirga litoralis]|uniref:Zn-dependent hydrolase n=1 Tax=Aestuariivirga litoralis TaxID=2650924 RepID=A0A2W2BU43_9HYPH|nr:MBL fold metallo-hydrolase [Aestuariivirga litoralis]PZF76996.1 Zn-dependent hydrolase [Aestuariivirga litoralis]